MSEESKTPEGDYVMMGDAPAKPSTNLHLDDPNLTQEEKDHRLAIALQQQENAAAIRTHQQRATANKQAQTNRTARSGTFSKLAAIRDKDSGMLQVPAAYTSEFGYQKSEGDHLPTTEFVPPPNASKKELADFEMAVELQKVEQVGAGTVRTMQRMVKDDDQTEKANANRTDRSKCTL